MSHYHKLVNTCIWLNCCTALAFCICPCTLKAQENRDKPITFETGVTGDFVDIFSGGAHTHHDLLYLGKEDIVINLSTEGLKLWKGGSFVAYGLNTHGATPTSTYVNDLQVFSNLEAGDHTLLFEIYYRQEFGNFTLMFGQNDMNAEFCATDYGALFLNSSFGVIPTISLNIPAPIYPMAAPDIFLSWTNGKGMTLKTALFDGDPGDFQSNHYGLTWDVNTSEGLLSVSELEYNRLENKGISCKIGGYYHSGSFTNNKDSTRIVTGNYGFYGILDKVLIKPAGEFDNGLEAFVQLGFAPTDRNLVTGYIGAGINSRGFFSKRIHDVIGIAVAHAAISKDITNANPGMLKSETSFEGTYKFVISDKYCIQPTLQYIIHPGALKTADNAVIGILRLCLAF